MSLKREPKAVCSVCGQLVYDNADPEKDITCGLCVQKRLTAFNEKNSPLEEDVKNRALKIVDRVGIRKVASFLGVSPATVSGWSKSKKLSGDRSASILKSFSAPDSPG